RINAMHPRSIPARTGNSLLVRVGYRLRPLALSEQIDRIRRLAYKSLAAANYYTELLHRTSVVQAIAAEFGLNRQPSLVDFRTLLAKRWRNTVADSALRPAARAQVRSHT